MITDNSEGPFNEPGRSCEIPLFGNSIEDDYCNASNFGEQLAKETLIDIESYFGRK
jgi:hypothetical protein